MKISRKTFEEDGFWIIDRDSGATVFDASSEYFLTLRKIKPQIDGLKGLKVSPTKVANLSDDAWDWVKSVYFGKLGPLDEEFWLHELLFDGILKLKSFQKSRYLGSSYGHARYRGPRPMVPGKGPTTLFNSRVVQIIPIYMFDEEATSNALILAIRDRLGYPKGSEVHKKFAELIVSIFSERSVESRRIWFFLGLNNYLGSDFDGSFGEYLDNFSTDLDLAYKNLSFLECSHSLSLIRLFLGSNPGSIRHQLSDRTLASLSSASKKSWFRLLERSNQNVKFVPTENNFEILFEYLESDVDLTAEEVTSLYRNSFVKKTIGASARELDNPDLSVLFSLITKFAQDSSKFKKDFLYQYHVKSFLDSFDSDEVQLDLRELAIVSFTIANPELWIKDNPKENPDGGRWKILEIALKNGKLESLFAVLIELILTSTDKITLLDKSDWIGAIESGAIDLGLTMTKTIVGDEEVHILARDNILGNFRKDIGI